MLISAVALAFLSASPAPGQDNRGSRRINVSEAEVLIKNIVYQGPNGSRTEATVVSPAARGQFPGTLFVHWYGPEHTNSNRTQFMPDALAMARLGIVSLLVDTAWTNPRWFTDRTPAQDETLIQEQIARLRLALEVLVSLDNVDARRLAYVGHDFGAMFGVSAVRQFGPMRAFVFIAGAPRLADWFTLGQKLDPPARTKVFEVLQPYDPVTNLPALAATDILFQFGSKDSYVSRPQADTLVAAVKGPSTAKYYDWGHDLNSDAMNDRVAWLTSALTLDGPRQ